MLPTIRFFVAWIAVFSFLLNGTVLPVRAANGQAMEICSTYGAHADVEIKQSPLYARDHQACKHCCATPQNVAPPIQLQNLFCTEPITRKVRITANHYADSAIANFQARAPPLISTPKENKQLSGVHISQI